MTLRHAAALTLVGRYLLMPPQKGDPPNNVQTDKDAPLSRWNHDSSYDTANACEQQLEALRSKHGISRVSKKLEAGEQIIAAEEKVLSYPGKRRKS